MHRQKKGREGLALSEGMGCTLTTSPKFPECYIGGALFKAVEIPL